MQITQVAPGTGPRAPADTGTATEPNADAASFLGLLKSVAADKELGPGALTAKGRRHTTPQMPDTMGAGTALLPAPIVLGNLPPQLPTMIAGQRQAGTGDATSPLATSHTAAALLPGVGTRTAAASLPDEGMHTAAAGAPLANTADHGFGAALLSSQAQAEQPTQQSSPAGAMPVAPAPAPNAVPVLKPLAVSPGAHVTQSVPTPVPDGATAAATGSLPMAAAAAAAATGNADERLHQTRAAEPTGGVMPHLASRPHAAVATVTTTASSARTVNLSEMTQQVTAQATLLHAGQQTAMRLRLRPPELGDVQVMMRRDAAGNLSAHIIAASHDAAQVLGANLHHLQAALDQHSQSQHAAVSLGWQSGTGAGHQQGNQEAAVDGTQDEPRSTNKVSGTTTGTATTSIRTARTGSTIDYDA